MATHSSTLAWRIPWREEPGTLQSMGSVHFMYTDMTELLHFSLTLLRAKWSFIFQTGRESILHHVV